MHRCVRAPKLSRGVRRRLTRCEEFGLIKESKGGAHTHCDACYSVGDRRIGEVAAD